MTHLPVLTFVPLADSALLIRFGDVPVIDVKVVAAVWMLTAALDVRRLVGVDDVVPAYATILVSFDPAQTDPSSLEREIREITYSLPTRPDLPEREVVIPTVYGGAFGPDLDDVASHTGLSPDEVIARHSGTLYRVACGGFAPGWDYLMGLPPDLATPRLPQPRTRTPPGSVGIGGTQTGIYPLETPGGWRLIGRTPLRLFDPDRADPFLLHPGDAVRFRPTRREEFATFLDRREIPRDARNGELVEASPSARDTRRRNGSIRVVQPGMLTTVQDLGRPGLARFGVAPGGALDRAALILGNRLLANDPSEAGLEITLLGPTLLFSAATTIALAGANLGARLNGSPFPLWQPVSIAAGDELSFLPTTGASVGARAYLCIAGGLAIDPVLGSRSTDLVGQFGGVSGRALRADDEIPLRLAEPETAAILRRRLVAALPDCPPVITARVALGPQQDRFSAEGVATFLDGEYAVSTKANRTGVRLTGPAIAHVETADLVSEGIAHGAIQVPGDGQSIVLLAARQTVGGYVKIATVIGADLDRFAQLRPGTMVRFTTVTPEEARAETVRYRAGLGPDAVVEGPAIITGWGPGKVAAALGGTANVGKGGEWDPAGVIEVIKAAQAAGVSSFRLELADAGLKLELHRSAESVAITGVDTPDREAAGHSPGETIITAPVLGVFYRRSGPDLPVIVEEGARVDSGQILALLEVMKTYHEIQAPHAGTLVAFLVDDGQFVEYGQPIARLSPEENDGVAP
jgi:KipI family sensor histidine kinase inhibitor